MPGYAHPLSLVCVQCTILSEQGRPRASLTHVQPRWSPSLGVFTERDHVFTVEVVARSHSACGYSLQRMAEKVETNDVDVGVFFTSLA